MVGPSGEDRGESEEASEMPAAAHNQPEGSGHELFFL